MSEFFLNQNKFFFLGGVGGGGQGVGEVKIDLDLSNYATKADLKNTKGVDKSDFAEKVDLGNLDKLVKLDIGKLKTTPIDLRKLSDVV